MTKHKNISLNVNNEDLARMIVINNLLADNKDITGDQKRFWNRHIYLIKIYYKDLDRYWNTISSKPLKIK